MRERHFFPHQFDFALFVLKLKDVAGAERGADAEQQHRRRQKAIGDQNREHVDVIALEVVDVPRQSPAQLRYGSGRLESGGAPARRRRE